MTAPTEPHVHHWRCELPHHGRTEAVCILCGAERVFFDSEWDSFGHSLNRERAAAEGRARKKAGKA